MEEFRKIFDINLENKKFIVLEHTFNKYYYFLKKVNKDEYEYPTLNEFIILNKKIIDNRAFFSIKSSDIKISSNNMFKLVPKIIYKGTAIILTFSMVLSILTGCNNKKMDDDTISITASTSAEAKNEKLYLSGIEEVSDYLDVVNPSWEDLLECVNSNSKLNEKYRKYLFEGIKNLKKNIPNLRLDILYYNLTDIEVIEEDDETYNKRFSNNLINRTSGIYEVSKNKVYLNLDTDNIKYNFFHEVFGHASCLTEFYKDNKHIIASSKLFKFNHLKYLPDHVILEMGYSYEEARAELVSQYALHDLKKEPIAPDTYMLEVQELFLILNTNNIGLDEFCNKGLAVLLNAVCDKNINCFELVSNMDRYEDMVRSGEYFEIEENYLISKNIEQYIYNYFEYLVNNGYSFNNAIEKIKRDVKKSNLGPCSTGGVFIIDIVDIGYKLEKYINNVKENYDSNSKKIKSNLTVVNLGMENIHINEHYEEFDETKIKIK